MILKKIKNTLFIWILICLSGCVSTPKINSFSHTPTGINRNKKERPVIISLMPFKDKRTKIKQLGAVALLPLVPYATSEIQGGAGEYSTKKKNRYDLLPPVGYREIIPLLAKYHISPVLKATDRYFDF